MLATLILSCAAIASRVMPSAATANVGALGASRWRPGLCTCLRQREAYRQNAQCGTLGFDPLHDSARVGDGARQAIELRADGHVASANEVESGF